MTASGAGASGSSGASGTPARGTLVQRARVAGLRGASWLACRLPERAVVALAGVVGWVWYRSAPARAAQARRNLGRVAAALDARGTGSPRARAAARDARALERLVVAAFRHDARYYLEVLRVPSLRPEIFEQRVVVETPDTVEDAFAGGPVIFVSAHFGPIELPGLYLANRSGRTFVAPMETVDDPPLQDWFERTRGSLGVRIVGLRHARRELQAAIRAGEPIGPALLAIETGAPIFAVGVRRLPDRRVAGRLLAVPVAADGSRRQRIAATLASIAAAFEELIADAPEQWSAVFFPIWPDLAGNPAPAATTGEPAATTGEPAP